MTGVRIFLDEHVDRVFERVLQARDHDAEQAKDQFGEYTQDEELLARSTENSTIRISNNAMDCESLHPEYDHAGILLDYDQKLPDTDPDEVPER